MSVKLEAGWVCVPYSGHDMSQVYIAVGDQEHWRPAFLDWSNGVRVAKIGEPERTGRAVTIWLKVNGSVISAGKIIL